MSQNNAYYDKARSLSNEISSIYHEIAVKMGISDSVQGILYVLCAQGDRCLQSDVFREAGMSRQTVNSAVRKLEAEGILYLEQGHGRNTILCLTEKGKQFAAEKATPLFEMEKIIFDGWPMEEQAEYVRLSQKFRDGLKEQCEALK